MRSNKTGAGGTTSDRRFRDLVEAFLEATVLVEDGLIIGGNARLYELFAYEDGELRGRPLTDILAHYARSDAQERVSDRKEGRFESVGQKKDGSEFPIAVSAREVQAEGRRLRVSSIRDLTERSRVERRLLEQQKYLEKLVAERTEELRKSETKYRNIFLNATEGIFQIAPGGRPLSLNPAFARIHGFESPEEMMEQVTDIVVLHVNPSRRKTYIGKMNREGHVRDFELRVRCKDGSVAWVSVNAKVVRNDAGKILYREGTVQDITERKSAEEALEIKSRSLKEANTALKVLLKHREEDRRELEEKFLLNVKQLVLPYVEKLKKSRLDTVQRTEVDFLETNLREILSPFLNNVRGFNLTPRQMEIVALIRDGRTTKEIAGILHVGKGAVDLQRFLIRKRLGINKDKSNLRSYLLSLT